MKILDGCYVCLLYTSDAADEEIMNLIDEIEAEESARIELADHAMNEV